MRKVGIMANGPANHIPNLTRYEKEIDVWIGVDHGALRLISKGISVNNAVGDFDSINKHEKAVIANKSIHIHTYPEEKDETDLEIAIKKAIGYEPEKIYLFGVTGGRMDHTLINIQLLHTIVSKNIRGIIVDTWNEVELTKPGTYLVNKSEHYPYISFVPFTKDVKGLSLSGFYYPLLDYDISWGSTRCISNELTRDKGSFTYEDGLLLFIQSYDVNNTE